MTKNNGYTLKKHGQCYVGSLMSIMVMVTILLSESNLNKSLIDKKEERLEKYNFLKVINNKHQNTDSFELKDRESKLFK